MLNYQLCFEVSSLSLKEPSQPSPHNTILNRDTLIVMKKAKAALMSNLEKPIENIGVLVFRAGLG